MRRIISCLCLIFTLALNGAVIDDFSAPKEWAAFDADNPAPKAEFTGDKMVLTTGGGAKDKIWCRAFASKPGKAIEFELTADAANNPNSYVYIVLRTRRDGANIITETVKIKPGEKQRISIPNNGRFLWRDQFFVLVCLHDAAQPMKVTVSSIVMPEKESIEMIFRDTPELKQKRAKQLLTAHTVQIDTDFPYYKNRSAESIASEIELAGFNGVYYYAMRQESIIRELVAELQKRNISVALMTLPNLVYWGEAEMAATLPSGWQDWLMQFTGNKMDIYRFIGFVYPEYNQWYKKYLNEMLKENNFDGFTFAEIMYPIYDGPEENPPFYGDVSPGFQAAFKKATGNNDFPDFTDPASPDYFKTNTKLYDALVEYRVKTINDFYDDIINAPDGARASAPGIMFATWTLGINIPDGVNKLRIWEGNDIGEMIRRVKPDMHFIQTHAPDWSNPNLKPDYAVAYKPFFDAIRQADSKVKVAMQADLGSLARSRRSPEWNDVFYRTCREQGIDSTTYYEFGLRHELYSAPPKLMAAKVTEVGIDLYFDQRIGSDSPEVMRNRDIHGALVTNATVDGNILRITLDKPLKQSGEILIPCGGIGDMPEVRYPASHVPPMPRGPVNRIPTGTTISIT